MMFFRKNIKYIRLAPPFDGLALSPTTCPGSAPVMASSCHDVCLAFNPLSSKDITTEACTHWLVCILDNCVLFERLFIVSSSGSLPTGMFSYQSLSYLLNYFLNYLATMHLVLSLTFWMYLYWEGLDCTYRFLSKSQIRNFKQLLS